MSKTLEQWIEMYNRKTPEPFKRDSRYDMLFDPAKGFCEIGSNEKMVIVNQMCGDIRYWRDLAEKICQALKLKCIGTYCIRDIKAYIRLNGFKIYKVEETPDGTRYYGTDESTGQKGQCSPAWTMPNGAKAYYVTWSINYEI